MRAGQHVPGPAVRTQLDGEGVGCLSAAPDPVPWAHPEVRGLHRARLDRQGRRAEHHVQPFLGVAGHELHGDRGVAAVVHGHPVPAAAAALRGPGHQLGGGLPERPDVQDSLGHHGVLRVLGGQDLHTVRGLPGRHLPGPRGTEQDRDRGGVAGVHRHLLGLDRGPPVQPSHHSEPVLVDDVPVVAHGQRHGRRTSRFEGRPGRLQRRRRTHGSSSGVHVPQDRRHHRAVPCALRL